MYNATPENNLKIQFEQECIQLDVSMDGEEINGWHVSPRRAPVVRYYRVIININQ